MTNPYDPPEQQSTPAISRRQLIFGLIFGGAVLAGVIFYQRLRFQQMELEMRRAVQRAQAAEMQAEEARKEAQAAAERAEFEAGRNAGN